MLHEILTIKLFGQKRPKFKDTHNALKVTIKSKIKPTFLRFNAKGPT